MGLFADITALFAAGYGWLFVTFIVVYELFAPMWLDRDTALAPLVRDLPQKVDDIDETQTDIRKNMDHVQDHVEEVQERQKLQMQVQRAQARATDNMDEEQVDNYLYQNGVTVGTFLNETADGGESDDAE